MIAIEKVELKFHKLQIGSSHTFRLHFLLELSVKDSFNQATRDSENLIKIPKYNRYNITLQ